MRINIFSDATDEKLDQELSSLCVEFPNCGERMLDQILKNKGQFFQRSRIRESLHRIDSGGIKLRKKNRLHRRIYNVQGPNDLWHIDTNHKLIRWYFVITGVIDGFSRLAVALKCTTNNKADTVLNCFLEGVHEFGIPVQIKVWKMF